MIEVPIPHAELLDKLSILEVKKEKGIAEVEKELDILLEIVESQDWWTLPYVYIYYRMLFTVNLELWEIEDKKRECEQNENFDNSFIELARAVYIINDERARIKKQINKYTKSNIFEHKHHRSY
jgi:hypothetical protein